MTAIEDTPTNPNFLSPLNFNFTIKRAPHLNFFVQKVNIAEFGGDVALEPTPFITVSQTPDHLKYENLVVTFLVDEDLNNYLQIHNWLRGIGFPTDFNEYKALWDQGQSSPMLDAGIASDISVSILNSAKMPNFEVIYYGCFPIRLTGFTMQTNDTDVKFITSTATFSYDYYDIKPMR